MPRQKVIFDTDPGVDDAMAMLYIDRCGALDLLGITTVLGNADIDTVTRNALYLKSASPSPRRSPGARTNP